MINLAKNKLNQLNLKLIRGKLLMSPQLIYNKKKHSNNKRNEKRKQSCRLGDLVTKQKNETFPA